jgi:hypothetical protein
MSKINLSFTVEGFEFKTPDGDCKLPKIGVSYDDEFEKEESVEAMKGFNTAFTAAFEQAFKATTTTTDTTPTTTTTTTETSNNFCEVQDDELSQHKVKFGKLYLNKKNGIPTLEVICSKGIYYMSWFRGYRIQISGSMDGDGDFGSSPVIAYFDKVFKDLDNSVKTSIIDMAAMHAVNKFCQYAGRDLIPPHIVFSDIYMKWLDETVKYTFKEDTSNVTICDDYYRELEPGVWEYIPYAERKAAEAKVADAKAEDDEE